jgi:glycosyltransferase involved in cell wall biosynthesis
LLQAFYRIREQQLDAALVFVGSGEQEAMLAHIVEAHNIPDVYFLGFRNQAELPLLYAIGDIFVMPTENEPWGLVINEAMAAGLPIIASEEIGAVPDLVQDGLNGYAFPAGNVEALTRRLQGLVSNPQLRQEMGAKSREIISNWGFKQDVTGFRAVLEHARNKKCLPGKSETA